MNPLNYATLEASKRLYDTGIVLETEVVWYQFWNGTNPYYSLSMKNLDRPFIPAPSMAEVWKELPNIFMFAGGAWTLVTVKFSDTTLVSYMSKGDKILVSFSNTNPTDALIDLLIWVRKERQC